MEASAAGGSGGGGRRRSRRGDSIGDERGIVAGALEVFLGAWADGWLWRSLTPDWNLRGLREGLREGLPGVL